jgi:hypothetical protein
MSGKTVPLILIAGIFVIFLAIYFVYPGSTGQASSGAPPAPATGSPVVEVVDTTADHTSWGAPEFSGTVKSDTGVPVTALIEADIYDASGRRQLGSGDHEVSLGPYGESTYQIIVFRFRNIPPDYTYRVTVRDVY